MIGRPFESQGKGSQPEVNQKTENREDKTSLQNSRSNSQPQKFRETVV